MKKPSDADPIRWRDQPPSRSEIETEIGQATRLLGAHVPPDELRLAQIRQRLSSARLPAAVGGVGWPDRGPWFVGPRFRTAGLVLASLGAGGVATAVTGRLIARHRAAVSPPAAVEISANAGRTARRAARRWRVAVNTPSQLDLSIGPDGTELAVVEGGAEIRGADPISVVTLEPGSSWNGDAPGVRPPAFVRTADSRAVPGEIPKEVPKAPPKEVPKTIPKEIPKAIPSATPRVFAMLEPRRARFPRRGLVGEARVLPVSPDGSVAPVPPEPTQPSAPLTEPSALDVERSAGDVPHTPSLAGLMSPAPRPSEAALLGRALRHLRSDHDPKRAIVELDEHDRRFLYGAFAREASLARAEALLALERKATALAVLDGVKLQGAAVDRWAEVARGELRAASGRHADAIADFDAVLDGGGDDELAARALFGRAVLREREGDSGGARGDLREYLRRFAKGPRRGDAEKILRGLAE